LAVAAQNTVHYKLSVTTSCECAYVCSCFLWHTLSLLYLMNLYKWLAHSCTRLFLAHLTFSTHQTDYIDSITTFYLLCSTVLVILAFHFDFMALCQLSSTR